MRSKSRDINFLDVPWRPFYGRHKFDRITCVPLFSETALSTVLLRQRARGSFAS